MRSDFSKAYLSAVNYMPDKLWRAAFSLSADQRADCEEIRLRIGRPPKALIRGKYISLTSKGELVTVDADDINEIIDRATGRSVHTYSSQLGSGFITTPEGHRIGVAGDCYVSSGRIQTIRDISYLNIRIAKPFCGVADSVIDKLYSDGFNSTLIISPPGGGKTTLLRDMSASLAQKYCVSVVDERYEIAGSRKNGRYFDIGDCDVMSGVSKSIGIETLIRSMSPHVIALDEITQEHDVEAICTAAYCGCMFLATAHAHSPKDMEQRPVYKKLLHSGVFNTIIRIDNQKGKRCYTAYTKGSECNVENRGNITDSGIVLGDWYFTKQEL